MLVDELLAYLFNGQPHLLAAPVAAWLASSRRFAAFVTIFRTKIRKKLRATQEIESLLDLRLELETAYLLLQERSFNLVYEPRLGGQLRGPDFAVSFTTSTLFMVEVTRLQMVQDSLRVLVQAQGQGLESFLPTTQMRSPLSERLADLVCSKLTQLPPQHGNILLVGAEVPRPTPDTLRAAMLPLQQRAERNDPTVMQRHRFRDRVDFFRHYQRLSELLVRGPELQADEPVIGWVNP